MIRLPSLHSHSGAGRKEGDREREGGRRGLMLLLLLGKNDAAAVLGGCRQTERGGWGVWAMRRGGGRGRRLAQSAVSDVGFTVSSPSGDLLRFSSVPTPG